VTIGHARQRTNIDDLRAQLAPAIAACKAGDHRVEVGLELTLSETVDVDVTVVPRLAGDSPAALSALHDCLVDAVWDTPLTLANPIDHDTKRVVLGPG
jgi:hypothetical protein